MKNKKLNKQVNSILFLVLSLFICNTQSVFARDIEVNANSGEIDVYVNPGEPTQMSFPADIEGGFKKKQSNISLDKKGTDLVIFPKESISESGEAIIVRLADGRSYSIRIKRAGEGKARDGFLNINDSRGSNILEEDEEDPAYMEKKFEYAPASTVSGFMREMMLATEFGKSAVPGYRKSDKYKGQVVLNDGTMLATIDSMYLGPNLWGYVVDTSNMLEQSQKINPASFRLDGTRAISASNWELAPKPYSLEQQIAKKHSSKVYIVTRAKK